MPRIAAQKSQRTVSNSLTRVVSKRERVVVQRRGKAVAALIPLEDLALLEELENQAEVDEALKVLNDPTDEIIPWDQAKTELDRA